MRFLVLEQRYQKNRIGGIAKLACRAHDYPAGGIRCRVIISDLQGRLQDFTVERDWEQFHMPMNLTMALAGEAGELTEIFQWLEPGESSDVLSDPTRAPHVREELADVFAYLLRPADALCIDLEDALAEKVVVTAAGTRSGPRVVARRNTAT